VTPRRILRGCAVLGVMLLVEWDPWLRFRDLDYHEGQQLAWMQHLGAGWKPGADLCCSYGPLYAWTLDGFMRLFGWSVLGLRWYFWVAQSLGAALAWSALRSTCVSAGFAAAGLGLYLIVSPAFLHWYGFANGLRQTMALAAMLAGVRAIETPAHRGRAVCAGLLLGGAVAYSPEAGLSAVAGWALAVGFLAGAGRRAGRPAAWTACFAAAAVTAVLTFGASGSPFDRLDTLFETSRQFLHGFLALPYLAGPVGRLLPALLLGSSAIWIARWTAGRPADGPAARHLALLVFGWAAFRGLLARTDLPHAREAVPAVILLVTWHAETAWHGIGRVPDRALRRLWRATWLAAAAGIGWFAAVRIGEAVHGGAESVGRPNILRSKSPAAWRIASDMQRAGLRVRVDLPRVGGLWLTPAQAGEAAWMTASLGRAVPPGNPMYAGPGAELAYFLADRVAANRYPVSMHGITPDAQAAIASSLARCPAVITSGMLLDDRDWAWWLPDVAGAVGTRYVAAGRNGPLTLWVRKRR